MDIKFKQMSDHLNQIQSQIKIVGSDMKTHVQMKVEEVRSDVKIAVTYMQKKVEEFEKKLQNVESDVTIARSELSKMKVNVNDVKQEALSGLTKGKSSNHLPVSHQPQPLLPPPGGFRATFLYVLSLLSWRLEQAK